MSTKTFCDMCGEEMKSAKGYILIGSIKRVEGVSWIFCSIKCLKVWLEARK